MMTAHYLLWKTRNGQRQWSGPYWERDQAEAAADMNLHCRENGYKIASEEVSRDG